MKWFLKWFPGNDFHITIGIIIAVLIIILCSSCATVPGDKITKLEKEQQEVKAIHNNFVTRVQADIGILNERTEWLKKELDEIKKKMKWRVAGND